MPHSCVHLHASCTSATQFETSCTQQLLPWQQLVLSVLSSCSGNTSRGFTTHMCHGSARGGALHGPPPQPGTHIWASQRQHQVWHPSHTQPQHPCATQCTTTTRSALQTTFHHPWCLKHHSCACLQLAGAGRQKPGKEHTRIDRSSKNGTPAAPPRAKCVPKTAAFIASGLPPRSFSIHC